MEIGGRSYECDDQAEPTLTAGRVRVPVFNGYANATLNFDDGQGETNAEQVAMLRHLVRITPVTQQTVKTVGDWKGWLARHGQTNVVLNELVESPAVMDVMEVYAALAERNIRPPYRNSVFGEAYQRGDVTLMRRYVEAASRQPWR